MKRGERRTVEGKMGSKTYTSEEKSQKMGDEKERQTFN